MPLLAEVLDHPETAQSETVRLCLSCNQPFISKGRNFRLCEGCRVMPKKAKADELDAELDRILSEIEEKKDLFQSVDNWDEIEAVSYNPWDMVDRIIDASREV